MTPHCDARVLHAPGKCLDCDKYSLWQELRMVWGINFTGEYHEDKQMCPSEFRRDIKTIYEWSGNRPTKGR